MTTAAFLPHNPVQNGSALATVVWSAYESGMGEPPLSFRTNIRYGFGARIGSDVNQPSRALPGPKKTIPGPRFQRFKKAIGLASLAAMSGCAMTPHSIPSSATGPGRTTASPDRPNVVLILVDDLGWPDVSSYGRKDVLTPNIDRIAESGVAFSNGYVAASVCSVSRAGLLTGRMPQTFGFTYNITDAPENGARGGDVGAGLPTDQPTLAERLKPLGYHTAAFGKWHQGSDPRFYPTNRGFDEFGGFLSGETIYVDPANPDMVTTETKADKGKPPLTVRSPNGSWMEGPDRRVVDNFQRYMTDVITDHAVDFINRSAGQKQPFFTYVAYNAPHWPMQVPHAWYDKFPQIKDPVRRTYVAMIAAMDAGIGQILDTLEKQGVRDNTMVVFLSDNGCPVQFGFCDEQHPFGWGKFTYIEGGTRVPFLFSWPAKIRPHPVIDSPVISLDIVPTVLTALDQPLPKNLDGRDLVSTISHPDPDRLLVWGQAPVFAARRGHLKLWQSDDWHESHLYDLDTDPWEKTDQSAAHPADKAALERAIADWRATLPDPRWKLHFTRPVTAGGHKTEWVY